MIGDKYVVKHDCKIDHISLKQSDILIESEAYNFETECYEDGGDCNNLNHEAYGFVCEVGSSFAIENLEKVI